MTYVKRCDADTPHDMRKGERYLELRQLSDSKAPVYCKDLCTEHARPLAATYIEGTFNGAFPALQLTWCEVF